MYKLGEIEGSNAKAMLVKPVSFKDEIKLLKQQLFVLSKAIAENNKGRRGDSPRNVYVDQFVGNQDLNKDGIPVGIYLFGYPQNGNPRLLLVNKGNYGLGNQSFKSLSAAAAGSGAPVRKSGWRFWKVADGRAVKEVYKKHV